ncbi:MAG: hypothetical protein EBX11_06595, partial [Actinobacteria bacterium]|nr:hypothetical protein [Actinomycetota bacterium]
IQVRRGTASQWTSANPTLGVGELGIETDTLKIKVGNGSSTWTQLTNYINVTPSGLSNSLGDYILLASQGNAGGPAELDSNGDLLIPENSAIFWNDPAYSYTTTLTTTQPTANRVITFPNATGTVALTSDITSAVTNLINAAPSALDTLNELAAAINNDSSFSTTVNNLLSGKVSKSGGDTITASTASTVGLIIKAATSQTANLLEFQDSSGLVVGKYNSSYQMTVGSLQATVGDVQARYGIYGGGTGYLGALSIVSWAANIPTAVLRGYASQTANLTEWQNSAGTVLAKVDASGIGTFAQASFAGGAATIDGGGGAALGAIYTGALKGSPTSYNFFSNVTGSPYATVVVKQLSGQTTNLQEWQNSSGITVASMDVSGKLIVPTLRGPAGNVITLGTDGQAYSLSISNTQFDSYGPVPWRPYNTSMVGFIIKGLASQTANLQEWQNSAGTVLAKIAADGSTTFASPIVGFVGNSGSYSSTAVSGYNIIHLSQGMFFINSQTGGDYNLATNSYYNSGWKYFESAGSTLLNFGNGRFDFNTALSGTAGNAITYTSKMIIANSGTVTINGFGAAAQGLIIKAAASQSADLQQWQNSNGTVLLSVSADGTLNKTGTLNIGPVLQFADPGVGNETKFNFQKTNDSAYLIVKEKATDQTYYEFGMWDNALDSQDYFQWYMGQWSGWAGYGWMPLQLGYNASPNGSKSQTLRFTGEQSVFWSPILTGSNTPYYTTNPNYQTHQDFEVTKGWAYTANSTNIPRTNASGGATLNIDLSGYTYASRMGYRLIVDAGGTTFSYTTYGGDNSSGSAIAITGGWQTLSNGTKIKINGTAAANDDWQFLAFPTPRVAFGGTTDTTSLVTIKPSASDKGLVIRAAASPTVSIQEWQNSSGTVLANIDSTGRFLSTRPFRTDDVITAGSQTATLGQISAISSTSSRIGLVVQGAASQTADLQQWQTSTGQTNLSINFGGALQSYIQTTADNINSGITSFIAKTSYANVKPMIVMGAASQTANLQEWQNSAGDVLAKVQANGDATIYGSIISTVGSLQVAYAMRNLSMSTSNSGIGIQSWTPTLVTAMIRGAASQTANLQEWQDSAGTIKSYIASDGSFSSSMDATINSLTIGRGGGNQISNVAIGLAALLSNTTGVGNTQIGLSSGQNITTGSYNVGVGNYTNLSLTTGTTNTSIGTSAGSTITTGSNITVLGYDAEPSSPTISNEITLGNANVTKLRIPGIGVDWTSSALNIGSNRVLTTQDEKNIYITDSGTARTLGSSDAYKILEFTSSSSITVTIPNDASDTTFPIGSYVEVRQMGGGQITVSATSPATLVATDNQYKTRVQYSAIVLEKRASNAWYLAGDTTA